MGEKQAGEQEQDGFEGVNVGRAVVQRVEFGGFDFVFFAELHDTRGDDGVGSECADRGKEQKPGDAHQERSARPEEQCGGGGECDQGDDHLVGLEGEEEVGRAGDAEGVVVVEEGGDADDEGHLSAEPEGPGEEEKRRKNGLHEVPVGECVVLRVLRNTEDSLVSFVARASEARPRSPCEKIAHGRDAHATKQSKQFA